MDSRVNGDDGTIKSSNISIVYPVFVAQVCKQSIRVWHGVSFIGKTGTRHTSEDTTLCVIIKSKKVIIQRYYLRCIGHLRGKCIGNPVRAKNDHSSVLYKPGVKIIIDVIGDLFMRARRDVKEEDIRLPPLNC